MPVYLKSIGASFFLIGLLEGIAEAVAGISKGYFGSYSDKLGKRLPFVQLGYGLTSLARGMLALFPAIAPIFISRIIDRIGKGIRTSARDALLADASPAGKKGTVFGFHRSMDTVGAAIGPMLALAYLYFYPGNYKSLFVIAFFPTIIAVFITFLIKEKKFAAASRENKPLHFFSFVKYWKQSDNSYKIVVSGLLFFVLLNSSDVFLLLTIKNKGYSDQYMIGIYIFYNLIYALLAYPAGRLADKFGLLKTILIGMVIFAGVYFSIGYADSLPLLIVLFFIYGIYAACFTATSTALITEHCKKEDTGTGLGFYNGFSSLIAILASSWTGLVWTHFNYTIAFQISAVGILLVVVFFFVKLKGRRK